MQMSLITDKEAELHEGYSAISELQSVQVFQFSDLGRMMNTTEIHAFIVYCQLKYAYLPLLNVFPSRIWLGLPVDVKVTHPGQ